MKGDSGKDGTGLFEDLRPERYTGKKVNLVRTSSNPKGRGFTLLELLVVLLIISISMSLFFGMNFRQKDAVIGRSFASELSQLMRTARSHALLAGQQNTCEYCPENRMIMEQLKGRFLKVPDAVHLIYEGNVLEKDFVFAAFFPDGSLVVETFAIRAGELMLFPETDPFLGRVRFIYQ